MDESPARSAPSRRRRIALGLGALALAGGGAVVAIIPATAASAACLSGSSATVYWFYQGGVQNNAIFGREESRSGECNNNGVYTGKVFDVLTDGSCVYAHYKDGSYTGVQGQSCDSGGYNYSFWDQTGDHAANYDLYTSLQSGGNQAISGY